jgi:hypothetical protein
MNVLECILIAAAVLFILPFLAALYLRIFLRGISREVVNAIKAIKHNLKG